jgi:hypothetical protein
MVGLLIIILLASSPVASAVIQVLFNPYVLEVNPIPVNSLKLIN